MKENKTLNKGIIKYLILGFFSCLAGVINGFLGTGAGIVLIYLLAYLEKENVKNNFAMTIMAVLPMSFVSLYFYVKGENVDYELIRLSLLPIILGGIVGAYLMDKIERKWLSLIFSALVIYSGFSMVLK
ncbi:MAG: sulfite exporter TauE/SafE family protein [Clostridia bacterium]|nr:sulfite exporter TauE/SafE family protein [Clostridia bacterium]